MDFDTGSSDLFLPGPKCGASYDKHKVYNLFASSVSRDLHNSFTLQDGDGSEASGEQHGDTVEIAGFIVGLVNSIRVLTWE